MAIRMESGTCRCNHITLHVKDLHWVSVSQRLVFKMTLLIWKCVHGVALVYLTDLSISAMATSGRQHLQSAMTKTLLVLHLWTTTGQQSLAISDGHTANTS